MLNNKFGLKLCIDLSSDKTNIKQNSENLIVFYEQSYLDSILDYFKSFSEILKKNKADKKISKIEPEKHLEKKTKRTEDKKDLLLDLQFNRVEFIFKHNMGCVFDQITKNLDVKFQTIHKELRSLVNVFIEDTILYKNFGEIRNIFEKLINTNKAKFLYSKRCMHT